jgi:hypothetical protein
MAWAVGYSTYQLRPASGTDQRLNGFGLEGQYRLNPAWSLEAELSHQTGTEAGAVDLRQTGFLFGPGFSRALSPRWEGSARFLVGREQLQASDGPDADQSTSFAFGPGVGADFALTRRVSLRGQEDFLFTHYAGVVQRSPRLFVGLVFR